MTDNSKPVVETSKLIADDFVAPQCHDFFSILYQDDDILLIDKPSGLFSLSGKNPLNWDSLHYRLVHGQQGTNQNNNLKYNLKYNTPAFPDAILPHRLDFGTSGIMVVALNAAAAKQLNKQFQQRSIKKRYVALLDGWLGGNGESESRGEISAPIAKDKTIFPKVKVCFENGKESRSEYRILKRLNNPERTLVQYIPHTGRTHQLRIHSLYIGHPILGCDLYHNEGSEQRAERLMLHASELIFQHPRSGEMIHGECACPFE